MTINYVSLSKCVEGLKLNLKRRRPCAESVAANRTVEAVGTAMFLQSKSITNVLN